MRVKGTRCGTGCWECRKRRIKCTKERPLCRNCQKSGRDCSYEPRYVWLEAHGHDDVGWSQVNQAHYRPKKPYRRIKDQLVFLNTTCSDVKQSISLDGTSPGAASYTWDLTTAPQESCMNQTMFGQSTLLIHGQVHEHVMEVIGPSSPGTLVRSFTVNNSIIHPALDYYGASAVDRYLFEYFATAMAPECFLGSEQNPYLRLLMPMALSSMSGSIRYAILSASAQQMHLVSHQRFERNSLLYRGTALSMLRKEIQSYKELPNALATGEQILGTLLMLCFFEVSKESTDTWNAHSRSAHAILGEIAQLSPYASGVDRLPSFVHEYFAAHDAFARTATALSRHSPPSASWHFPTNMAYQTISGLLGCSRELVDIINSISDMAENVERTHSFENNEIMMLCSSRDEIERRLHTLEQCAPVTDNSETSVVTSRTLLLIAEVKRMCALIYFYTKLDDGQPQHPHIARLTEKILELLPRLPLWNNALLWPLFVVGAMGLQPCDDENRQLVIERFQSLQQTRQLNNVMKAMEVVESIWKQRDLAVMQHVDLTQLMKGLSETISLA